MSASRVTTSMAEVSPEDFSVSATRTFRGEDFAVQLSVQDTSAGPALRVVCERLRDHELWSADFAATYVEELTVKMGAPKKLPAFCAMLRAGLRGRPSSVSLELLTASDLEALKTRRQARDGAGQVPSSSGGGSVTGKRYLVVTHAPEFGDRLHLPLPLLPCESPPSLLRLPSAECILALRAENQALRGELATAQGLLGTSSLGRATAGLSSGSATRALEARLEAAESELEALGMAHRALQKRAAAEVATLMAELSARRDGERDYRVRLASARAEVDALTRRLRATEARVGLRGSAASANFTYSRPGSRPSSRPSSPYAAAPGSRGASPARTSRPPSAPGSPYTSGHRPASAPRERPHSPVPVFDPTAYAADRAHRLAAAATLRASAFGGTSGRGSSPAPGSRSSTPTAGWRSPAQSPRRAGGAGGGAATGGAGLSPRESPRRALLHVKSKLHALTGKPLVPAAPTAPEDSAAAIADIDARLHALQDFLRAAKATQAV